MFMISYHFLSAMPKGSEERWAESGGGRAEAPAEPITIHHDMPQKVFQWWEEVTSECCSMIVLPVTPTSAPHHLHAALRTCPTCFCRSYTPV